MMQKKVIVWIGLALCTSTLSAQKFVDNRLTVSLGYSVNHTMGGKTVSVAGYTTPSLVSNFRKTRSLELAATYKINRLLRAHAGITNSAFWDWKYKQDKRFDGAIYSVLALHPELEISTPFKEIGARNRTSFFVRAGPAVGIHAIALQRSPFTGTGTDFDFSRSRFFSTGFSFAGGTTFTITNQIVLGLSYGVTRYGISSPLFDDRSLTFSSLNFKVGYRLVLNKHYKYAPQWFD